MPDGGITPAPSLVGAWYTDPAVFAAEQRTIFARRWMCVGRGDELAESGAFLTVDVAGESIVVVRGDQGEAHAFHNVCRHRGARLLREPAGSCGHVVRCPYHAWTYALDGTLRGAPNFPGLVREHREAFSLHRVGIAERHGFLWVNLAGDAAAAFDEDIGAQIRERMGSDELVARWGMERLATGRRLVYDVAANWKLLVENFSECYHCATVHPELTTVLPEFRRGQGTLQAAGYGAAYGQGIDGFTVDGRAGLAPLPGLSDDEARRYYGIVLTPNVFLHLVGDHVITHWLEPQAADRTRVTCVWLFAPEALAAGVDIAPSVQLFERTNGQDFDVCERCQLGAASSSFAGGGVLAPIEEHLARFHDEVRAAVGAAAPERDAR